ncbi:LLM class flavin-dependent oxidoreductase [Pseudochelatococcus sp. B33]
MAKTRKQLKLGFSMAGNGGHKAGWRHPLARVESTSQFSVWKDMAAALEKARIHYIFLADGAAVRIDAADDDALSYSGQVDKFEPLTLLSAVAAVTNHIGLVATASTTYNEPYTIARKYASLDHLSGGRAGWNVVTTWSEHEAKNFNRTTNLEHALRYKRAEEFVDIVMGLWDGWEDGAFIRDKATGRYFDPAKLHNLFYKSENFSVRGPLNIERPIQGYPLIAQAGQSEPGQELAARTADVVYTVQYRLEEAQAFYRGLKGRMAKYDRSEDELLILPGLNVIVGRTEDEAQEKFHALQDLIHFQTGMNILRGQIKGVENFPLDEPLPEIEMETGMVKSVLQVILARARRDNMTVRDLCKFVATSNHNIIVGTPGKIADMMGEWFEAGACDGFSLQAPYFAQGLYDILDLLIPELQERGLFQAEYAGGTLRENLGLKRPVNQFLDPLHSRVTRARMAQLKSA